MSRHGVAVALALVLLATGCTSTTDGVPRPRPSASGTSAVADGTSAPHGIEALLITVADLDDPSFQETPYTPSKQPAPCTPKAKGTLDQQVKPTAAAGRDLARSADPQALVEEQIRTYADAATAQRAMTALKAGLGCASGVTYNHDGSTAPVAITGPRNVTGALLPSRVDEAYDWTVTGTAVVGDAVAVRAGNTLVLVQVVSLVGAATTTLPKPLAVTVAAVRKVMAGR